jgi:ribosomal protein S18 acetylase RimI-like enzyme
VRVKYQTELTALRDELASFEFVACGMRHEQVLGIAPLDFLPQQAAIPPQIHARAKLCAAAIRRRRPLCGHTMARTRLRYAVEMIGNEAASLRTDLEQLDLRIGALDHAMGNAQLQLSLDAGAHDRTAPNPSPEITVLEQEQIVLMKQLKSLTEKIVQMIEAALNREARAMAQSCSTKQSGISAILSMRNASAADEAFQYRLFRSVKAEEMGALQWDEMTLNILMRSQFDAHELHYRSLKHAYDLLIQYGTDMVGRMIVLRDGTTIHVADISLLPEYRGKGIGQILIGGLQQEAVNAKLPLRLRVLPSNRAADFYLRMGFVFTDEGAPYRLMEWRPAA